tara:strand:- start:67 stop:525 length:459 start_codon:yes stop_codon:yes gene_type:complete
MAKEGTYLWHIYDDELKKFFIWSGTVDYMYESEHAEKLPKFIRNFFTGMDMYVRWLKRPKKVPTRSGYNWGGPSYLLRSLYDEEDEYNDDVCHTVAIHEEFYSLRELKLYLRLNIRDDGGVFPVRAHTLKEFYEDYGYSVYKRVSVDECPDV